MSSRKVKRRRQARKCWACENTRVMYFMDMKGGEWVGSHEGPCPVCKKKVEPEL